MEHYRNGTPHNAAKLGDIASFVLMPGDPLRAKHVAETYLDDAAQFNGVRGMLGYTGSFEGKRLSIMASGMGGPSMGIYSYELFAFYGVDAIVRIGTCGGLTETLKVGDLAFAMTSSTDSNYAHQYGLSGNFSPCADYGLLERAVAIARERGYRHWVGGAFSSDVFSLYSALPEDEGWRKWARMGCAATDMESFALYCNAAYLGKKALAMFTCSDSNVSHEEMSPEARQSALDHMFDVALRLAP
jgi:purine-nucleoside phosphorylase, family 1 (deoD)